NIEPYHAAVDTAFKEAGIPYFLDHEIPLLSLPVAQFVKKLFGLYANDFVRADAMFVLRSWYFRLDQIGLSKDKLDAIDIASLNSVHAASDLSNLFVKTKPPSIGTQSGFCSWCEDVIAKLSHLKADENSELLQSVKVKDAIAAIQNVLSLLIEE